MDKRTLLALFLMALVIVVTPLIFPSARRSTPRPADSAARRAAATDSAVVPPGVDARARRDSAIPPAASSKPVEAGTTTGATQPPASTRSVRAETVVVAGSPTR